MNDLNVIDQFMQTFIRYIDGGFGLLGGDVAFLTTTFAPKEALTGWLGTVATYNPVTYLLEGLRSLVTSGWDGAALGRAALAVVAVGAVSQLLAHAALRGRLSSGRR